MSLTKEWLLPVARTLIKLKAEGPVYVLGDQITWFTHDYARRKLGRAGLLRNPAAPIIPCHANPKMVSFRTVLAMIGLTDFHDIDLNGKAELPWDLSKPIPTEFKGRAGVVIDIGTCEHIFNLPQVFSNIVELLGKGGLVLHLSPLSWYNHGFVNFNPIWFKEFYQCNRFQLLEHGLIVSPFAYSMLALHTRLGLGEYYLESRVTPPTFILNDESWTLAGISNHVGIGGRVIILFAACKTNDSQGVELPCQGMYRESILKERDSSG